MTGARAATSALLTMLCMAQFAQAQVFQQPPALGPGYAGGAPPQPGDLQQRLQKIDAMVQARMAALNIPGYCLTVIMDGQVVMHKPYGFASIEESRPATNDTVFGLASVTKTFTALTLLALVDRGLVNLDDPLSRFIDGLTAPYQSLTIRQLASMTAGVPTSVAREVDWKDQLDILDHTPLQSLPGSEFHYSNFSYRLLGSVIARVTGRPYLEVVREIILNPLSMNSTATTVLMQPTGRVAQGYGDQQGSGPVRPIRYKDPAVSFSAGMLASTNDDLVNYVFALMQRKIISEGGYNTLWFSRPPLSTGRPSRWAFGWSAGPTAYLNGSYALAMNGGTPGVASSIIIVPETNSAVIALCNLRKPPVYEIARTVARLAFADDNALPVQEDDLPAAALTDD